LKLNLFQQIFLCKVKITEKVTIQSKRLFIVVIGDWKQKITMTYNSYINIQTTPSMIKAKLTLANGLVIVIIDERRYNTRIVHKMFMMIPDLYHP